MKARGIRTGIPAVRKVLMKIIMMKDEYSL
jgi:hypothetical protein